jgi:hypothetical protein
LGYVWVQLPKEFFAKIKSKNHKIVERLKNAPIITFLPTTTKKTIKSKICKNNKSNNKHIINVKFLTL